MSTIPLPFTCYITPTVSLVTKGKYTILDMGEISSEVIIAISSLILVTAALHYHIKGAFCVGLMFGTFMWWIFSTEWPKGTASFLSNVKNSCNACHATE